MSRQEVFAVIGEILEEIFGSNSVALSEATRLKEIERWDSFQYINLIISLEDRCNVKFEATAVEEFSTVGDIVEATMTLLNG